MTPRPTSPDPYDEARRSAYGAGEYVDQQGFMRAGDIRRLAHAAGVGRDTRVLDLCCGRGGPGQLLAEELGREVLGVDADPVAIDIARERAGGLPCRYEVGHVPPLPAGGFDVVLLLETMLAFRDKQALLRAVRAALEPGGRFAATFEVGEALTPEEAAVMTDSATVWPTPFDRMLEMLADAGLTPTWHEEVTTGHLEVVDALLAAFVEHRRTIGERIGHERLEGLLTAHRLWRDWLASGRIRKVAFVAGADGSYLAQERDDHA